MLVEALKELTRHLPPSLTTVLTPRALRTEELDPQAAAQALETAASPATTPEAQEARTKAQMRARAQLRMARRNQGE